MTISSLFAHSWQQFFILCEAFPTYISNLLQNFAVFGYRAITTVFKRSFVPANLANFEFVWLLVITTICFATQINHFCATDFFFE